MTVYRNNKRLGENIKKTKQNWYSAIQSILKKIKKDNNNSIFWFEIKVFQNVRNTVFVFFMS